MDYTVLHIAVSDDEQAEILTAELADFPFESFETEDGLLKAYIPAVRLSGCKTDVDALLARRGVEGRYAVIPTQNWNASWESDFPPVDVEGRLRIRAPFHDPAPAGEMEAVVLPRMSFGTGHHATTWLMSRAVLGLGVAGRTGLDMGSGTGVLAIVAAKCGAAHVDAVDIDDWADENCRENVAANGVADRVEPMLGDVGRIAGRRYDFILAMGDDTTDDDMFEALPRDSFAVKVGSVSEKALYNMPQQERVLPFLRSLTEKVPDASEPSRKRPGRTAIRFVKRLLQTKNR